MNLNWKNSHPVQPFSPRQIQLHYVIPDIFVLSVLNDCQWRNTATSQSQLFQCFTTFSIWKFSLFSNLKFFPCSRKPLISCTINHDTENTLCLSLCIALKILRTHQVPAHFSLLETKQLSFFWSFLHSYPSAILHHPYLDTISLFKSDAQAWAQALQP